MGSNRVVVAVVVTDQVRGIWSRMARDLLKDARGAVRTSLFVILLALALVVALAGSTSLAEDEVSTLVSIYVDDDSTTIVTPMFSIQKDIYEETSLNFQYLADIQSCASVDVVSTASPSMGYEETRHSFTLGLQHRRQLTTMGAGFSYSTEHDYISHAFVGSLSQELLQRNFTVGLTLSVRWDEIGRVNDEFFKEDLTGVSANLSLTQLISPRWIGQFVYSMEYLDGFQSSPYRLVPIGAKNTVDAAFSVPETHPSLRFRNSFTGRLKESVSERWFLEQSLRFYFDTWGITAQTVLLQAYWQVSHPVTLRFRYRFHNQNRADFYRESYDSLQEFLSRDRELGTLQTHLLGPQFQYRTESFWMFDKASFDAKVEYFYINYEDYALLENKEGLLIGTGVYLYY